jgi:hypothetical protein
MPKRVGVEMERIKNKKSTTSHSICWSSYKRYYKMLGSTIKIRKLSVLVFFEHKKLFPALSQSGHILTYMEACQGCDEESCADPGSLALRMPCHTLGMCVVPSYSYPWLFPLSHHAV